MRGAAAPRAKLQPAAPRALMPSRQPGSVPALPGLLRSPAFGLRSGLRSLLRSQRGAVHAPHRHRIGVELPRAVVGPRGDRVRPVARGSAHATCPGRGPWCRGPRGGRRRRSRLAPRACRPSRTPPSAASWRTCPRCRARSPRRPAERPPPRVPVLAVGPGPGCGPGCGPGWGPGCGPGCGCGAGGGVPPPASSAAHGLPAPSRKSFAARSTNPGFAIRFCTAVKAGFTFTPPWRAVRVGARRPHAIEPGDVACARQLPVLDVPAEHRVGDHVVLGDVPCRFPSEDDPLAVAVDHVARDVRALRVGVHLHAAVGVVVDPVVDHADVVRRLDVDPVLVVVGG